MYYTEILIEKLFIRTWSQINRNGFINLI